MRPGISTIAWQDTSITILHKRPQLLRSLLPTIRTPIQTSISTTLNKFLTTCLPFSQPDTMRFTTFIVRATLFLASLVFGADGISVNNKTPGGDLQSFMGPHTVGIMEGSCVQVGITSEIECLLYWFKKSPPSGMEVCKTSMDQIYYMLEGEMNTDLGKVCSSAKSDLSYTTELLAIIELATIPPRGPSIVDAIKGFLPFSAVKREDKSRVMLGIWISALAKSQTRTLRSLRSCQTHLRRFAADSQNVSGSIPSWAWVLDEVLDLQQLTLGSVNYGTTAELVKSLNMRFEKQYSNALNRDALIKLMTSLYPRVPDACGLLAPNLASMPEEGFDWGVVAEFSRNRSARYQQHTSRNGL